MQQNVAASVDGLVFGVTMVAQRRTKFMLEAWVVTFEDPNTNEVEVIGVALSEKGVAQVALDWQSEDGFVLTETRMNEGKLEILGTWADADEPEVFFVGTKFPVQA
jgi:hypothetical protein